jgi:retron-type reverse transcriptase
VKRYGYLWQRIIAFDNILLATKKAQRSKRFRPNVLEFNYSLEIEIITLQKELETKNYQPSPYKVFQIIDPKPREISAATYRDRIVHHALCNIITPIFEQSFIPNSYANRQGFGTHKALKQFIKFAYSSQYILQCDIKKYFASIDHQILKDIIRQKIKCPDTLWLVDLIIDHSNPQQPVFDYFPNDDLLTPLSHRKGLPLGNLTSQFFANIYLSQFDHFAQDNLKAKKYLRYVDDFAIFSNDLVYLKFVKQEIHNYLANLRLVLHPNKTQIFPVKYGANFVGFRVLPDRISVISRNVRRIRKRIKCSIKQLKSGKIDIQQLSQSIQSWKGHLQHGDTWRLQQQLFGTLELDLNKLAKESREGANP